MFLALHTPPEKDASEAVFGAKSAQQWLHPHLCPSSEPLCTKRHKQGRPFEDNEDSLDTIGLA